MAAGRLPTPGTEYGPCADTTCQHLDCKATRQLAERVCKYCLEPIGYERGFYILGGRNHEDAVHSACYEDALEDERKAVQ